MDNFNIGAVTTYQAGAAQANVHRMLQKLCDEILNPFGITKMQWMIIGTVLDAGKEGARVSDIADNLGTTMAYLTTTINLLESRNILQRSENAADSRSKLVTVAPQYLATCEDIEVIMRNALRDTIYSKIDRKEFLIYMKVLYQLIEVGKKQ